MKDPTIHFIPAEEPMFGSPGTPDSYKINHFKTCIDLVILICGEKEAVQYKGTTYKCPSVTALDQYNGLILCSRLDLNIEKALDNVADLMLKSKRLKNQFIEECMQLLYPYIMSKTVI